MATAATIDTSYLSTYSAVPESTIQSLITQPTTELVTRFLQAIVIKAQEHERLKAERLRLDVELENAVRGADLRAKILKTNAEKSLKEVEELRKNLVEEETARTRLSDQLHSLQSDSSNTSVEVEALQSQVAKLEKSNRDALVLLDSKSTSHDSLAEELSSQHQKTVGLRRDVSSLSERLQTVENSLSNAKLLESQLRSEIDQQRRNSEWLGSELKTKSAEHAKFRKEKNSRISELQRLNDDAASSIDLLERTETTLRKRLEEVGQKADEAFTKVQQLQEDAVRTEQSFRSELDTARRLVDLQKQSADTARRRVQELEDDMEKVKDEATEEIGQAQAEIETERQLREAAEQRVEQLESQVEKLEVSVQSGSRLGSSGATQPNTNGLGGFATPPRGGSPMQFSPASTRSRGGLNYTQIYGDYTTAKAELEAERRRNEKLTQTLDDLIKEMEDKEPEIQESQLEHSRLASENADLMRLLADAREEKDAAKKEARKWQGSVTGARREAELLKQQLRDLSAQIKMLLVEAQARDDNTEFTAAERLHLQQQVRGGSDGDVNQKVSDTARFISERLVTFKNVFELQEKNSELIRIVRELGEQRESEEGKTNANAQAQTESELENLRERVERYKDEMKSLVTQSQSYVRERDMFRRMLSHRGQLPPDADMEPMFGSSLNGADSPRTPQAKRAAGMPDGTPSAKDLADYSRLLKELQNQFDAYRRETATDYTTVKQQASELAKDKNKLQIEVVRVNSQLTLASERYQMLQANFDQIKTESQELRKRSQSLAEVANKQDLRTQQVAEELVDARGLADSLRHENANLKAEKELWRKIEERMSEDSKVLLEERSRLNKTLTDSQTLYNERELTESDNRRKLQSQLDSLELQLRTANQKLEQEIEAGKNLNLRREYEVEQHRTRVDDLLKVLGTTKEELVAATTVRDQLQARVEELKIELRNAEDRVQALQPRPVARGSASTLEDDAEVSAPTLTTEQELAVEVADLRKELELQKAELVDAHAQAEQYRNISQSSEEELNSLNDTHDQYRAEMDRIIAERDAKITDLETRVREISDELSVSHDQLSAMRSSSEEISTKIEQQRVVFEEQVTHIKDEADRYKEVATFHEQDLKAQAEIAQQAQTNYENELVKHGEATKALHVARSELNEVRLEVAQHKADADAARAAVAQNEESWSTTKDRYEAEIIELKSRRGDIDTQNRILHQQLESFSSQIAALQQRRDVARSDMEEQEVHTLGVQNLQDLISYLRREKEIVDVQYELTVQASKRLRQQLDYTQSQLDDTRLKLDLERQRDTEREQTSMNHSKLLDSINELNVFRESTVTLRNEARQAQAQLAEKTKQLETAVIQLEPLKISIQEMTSNHETREGEMKLMEEDRDRWRQRAQNILQKYDRIDPAELEALKDQLSSLQSEREASGAQIKALQAQLDGFPEQIRLAQDEVRNQLKERLTEQFKARSRELSAKINDANNRNNSLKEELDALKITLATTTANLESEVEAHKLTLTQTDGLRLENSQLRTSHAQPVGETSPANDTEEGQIEENAGADKGDAQLELERRLAAEEAKAADAENRAAEAHAEVETLRAKVSSLEKQVEDFREIVANLTSELTNLRSQPEQANTLPLDQNHEKLKQDLTTAQQEIEAMRNEALRNASAKSTMEANDDGNPHVGIEQQLASLRAELEATHQQRVQQLEEKFKSRVENMKQQLNTKLNDGRANLRAEVAKEHEQALQDLRQEHTAAETQLKQEHEALLSDIKHEHAQELDQLRKTHPGASSENETQAKAAEVPVVKLETVASSSDTEWTPARVRAFISTNETAREILTRNIKAKLEQESTKVRELCEKDAAQKLEDSKTTFDKKLAEMVEETKAEASKTLADQLEEAKQRADKLKEQAVIMEGKKWNAKVSMAEGRSRSALAKVEFMSKAAEDTPQRPVGEVWAIAKDVKGAPVQPAVMIPTSAAPNPAVALQSPQAAQSPTMRKPLTITTTASIPSTGLNTSGANNQQERRQSVVARNERSQAENSTGLNTNIPLSRPTAADGPPAQSIALPPKPQATQQLQGTGPAGLRGGHGHGSGIPRGGANIRGLARGGRGGENDQGARVQGNSTLAQPNQASAQAQGPPGNFSHAQTAGQRGGAGSGIPRGGIAGRGRGREGNAAAGGVSTPSGSPGTGRGAMNPQAGNFQPGHKRPRGDSPAGLDEVGGKRVRGGGAGN